MLSAVAGVLIVLSIGILVAHAISLEVMKRFYRTLTNTPHAAAKPIATSRSYGLSQSAPPLVHLNTS
jgi:hypothetical protein